MSSVEQDGVSLAETAAPAVEPAFALRSMLFAPANRPDLVGKALASGTDAVLVDLEDSVPLEAKAAARNGLAELPRTDVPMYVRVNGAETGLLWKDVVAAGQARVDGIVVAKAEDPDLFRRIDGALTALEMADGRPPGSTHLIPLIESAIGVRQSYELCTSAPRVVSVLFGSGEQGDLVADLGCEWTPEGTGLMHARSQVLLSARAAGIQAPMDAVFMNFRDQEALRVECELARRLGYVGKTAIHPAQVVVIHDVFTPAAAEVERQRRILTAFDRAVAEGSASISVDGRMVDYAVARTARTVLARADAADRASRRTAHQLEDTK